MRQLDNYEQFFDNDKNFLVGSLTFCKKGTSTQTPVYAWDSEHNDYVEINPVQFVSIDGRPANQIFLSDEDYTIYVSKYIGNGNMETDTDPNNWLPQYSFNNLYDVISLQWTNNQGLGLFVFETLQDMKTTIAVDMYSDSMVVALAGWTTKGDKPITYYYWDENCNETATDVEFVKPQWVTGAGRWVLINEFEAGFDVRNAGCFPTASSSGDIEQTYALQRAEAYCIKYGLKMVIPHTLGSEASCYNLSNLILNSSVYIADGVNLYTANSATLNNVSNDNRGRSVAFVCRDASNKGNWTIVGENIETAYFQNNDANEPTGWRPTITPKGSLVYNKTFDSVYDNTRNPFEFENIRIDFEVTANEEFYFDSCTIMADEKILYPCKFTDCEIGQKIFSDSIDYATFAFMQFVNCVSDFGNWNDPNLFVIYKALNGDPTIDLQGQRCSIDLNDYNIDYCFQNIDNAIFDILKMPKNSGAFSELLYMHNVKVHNLDIEDNNTNLQEWHVDDCEINISDTSFSLANCSLWANNTKFSSGSGSLGVAFVLMRECKMFCEMIVSGGSASICDCQFFDGNVILVNDSGNPFVIVFNGNMLANSAMIVFDLNGNSDVGFSDSSFCDNVVHDGEREFVDTLFNGGTWSTDEDNMHYVYSGNKGVIKKDNTRFLLSLPFYGANDSVPAGTTKYIKRVSGYEAKMYGVTLSDFVFGFGEGLHKDIAVELKVGMYSDFANNNPLWYVGIINDLGATTIYDQGESVWSIPVIHKKGSPVNRQLFNESDTELNCSISTTAVSGSLVVGYLDIHYVD